METVGLIGVGLLGSAIAERLRGAGYAVLACDADSERMQAARELGCLTMPAAEVAEAVEEVITCLPDGSVVRDAVSPLLPVLTPRTVLIDTTTCSPDEAVALAAKLAERGVKCLDAAVSGSSAQVKAGEGTLLVGGESDVVERCAPILRAIAPRVHHVGGHGAGMTAKLVTNLILGLNRFALAEGLNLGLAAGLDGSSLLAVLKDSAAYSRVMDTKGERMLRLAAGDDDPPEARLRQHLKDVRLVVELARSLAAPVPLEESHRELLERAVQDGWGEADNAAVVGWLRSGAAVGRTMFKELKHNLNKPDQVFECELLRREPGGVVLRYVSPVEMRVADVPIPAGSTTLALYCEGGGYVVWEMTSPEGTPIGRLFHLCEGIRNSNDSVSYTDLLLDLWEAPGGEVRELDRDEVEEALAKGWLSAEQLRRVEETAQQLQRLLAAGAVPPIEGALH